MNAWWHLSQFVNYQFFCCTTKFTHTKNQWCCYILNGSWFVSGRGRLYPAYSLSGSEGEESLGRRYGEPHTYQHPLYQQPAGLSDTPTSENASDATLTDSELALARDSTLLVHNGKFSICCSCAKEFGQLVFKVKGFCCTCKNVQRKSMNLNLVMKGNVLLFLIKRNSLVAFLAERP